MPDIPQSLMPISPEEIKKQGRLIERGDLLLLKHDSFDRGQLYVFNAPIRIPEKIFSISCDSKGFFISPEGSKRFEWYIDPARERGKDLWGSFSEQLVMLRLKGRKRGYELHCGQAKSLIGMGVEYSNSYFMSVITPQDLEQALNFGAREMVRLAGIADLPEREIDKLTEFLMTDYRTSEYTRQSNKVGLEADSVFFPG